VPIVVQKYGGTSVDGHEKVLAVANRVKALRQDGYDVIVVVSARGGATDALLGEARLLADEPAQRELDMLMTAGERVSMSLLAIALNGIGCPAVSFTGSQVGIITDTRHTDARILEVRPYRVVEELEAGNVVVVGGFQGVSTAKEITTLGRGGSDTTAVALAAALGAERCEILSDVDGVYTADPNSVEGARRIDEISYDDMATLARYGATVLKEDAVRLAERCGIALFVGASDRDVPGTIVLESPAGREEPVSGLTLLPEVALVSLPANDAEGLVDDVARLGDAVKLVAATNEGAAIAVDRRGRPENGLGPRVEATRPASLIAAVGPGAGGAATVARVLTVVRDLGHKVMVVVSSGRSTVVAVPTEAAEEILQALHSALFQVQRYR